MKISSLRFRAVISHMLLILTQAVALFCYSVYDSAATLHSYSFVGGFLVLSAIGGFAFARGLAWTVQAGLDKNAHEAHMTIDAMAVETRVGADKLNSATENLQAASQEQMAAVQESVSSISQMRGMLEQTLENAKATKALGYDINEKAAQGTNVMTQMAQSVEDIESSKTQLLQLNSIIDEIRRRTQVINEIVFKTQLLSFNASIEATRAGKHGKGIAVVASEIGNLAQMSGAAAKEIENLIKDSQNRVAGVIDYVTGKIGEGKSRAQETFSKFSEIADGIKKVSEAAEGVAYASQEQFAGVSQTLRAMHQMSEATTAHSAAIQQIIAIATRMKGGDAPGFASTPVAAESTMVTTVSVAPKNVLEFAESLKDKSKRNEVRYIDADSRNDEALFRKKK